GPQVERVPQLAFQRPEAEIELAPADAERRGIGDGDPVLVRSNGASVALRARLAAARPRRGARGGGARSRAARGGRGGEAVTPLLLDVNGEPWWITLIKAFVVINLVLVTFAYLTLAERKVMGRMQLRYGPNRVGPY